MEEISIKDYIGVIAKRKLMIILITVIATVASFGVSKFLIKPTYSATATLIVGNTKQDQSKEADINELMAYDKLVSTYSKVITSRNVLDDAVKKLSFKTNAGALNAMITVTPEQDTQLIDVAVKSTDKKRAQEVANQVSKTFVSNISNIMKIEQNVHVLDRAELPGAPVSPKVPLNTAIAFFIGLMLSMFIAFLLEYLDDTIKTPEDIEKHLGIAVIGTIPMVTEELLEKGENRK